MNTLEELYIYILKRSKVPNVHLNKTKYVILLVTLICVL